MTDEDGDGPPDPQLDPTRSPGFGGGVKPLSEIDVGRDVTLGEADPAELTVSDTSSLADASMATLRERLTGDDVVERRRAALALADRSVDEETSRALATAVRSDDDAEVRQFAVEALGAGSGAVAERAALAALDDSNPWVRAEAVVALDHLDGTGHAELIAAALDDGHHAVRRNAAISEFKRRGEESEPLLLDLLEDTSDRVREWAAHMLGGVDSDESRAALERAAETDESRIVRLTAAKARQTDPVAFRRRFRGTTDGEPIQDVDDPLNRQPDL